MRRSRSLFGVREAALSALLALALSSVLVGLVEGRMEIVGPPAPVHATR